jgi:hypothetical protein
MAANKRVFYACEGFQLRPVKVDGTTETRGTYKTPRGVQSVGMTTNFNLEKIFQLGQLALYENIEGNPEIEVTVNKILDGTRPLFLTCLSGDDSTSTLSIVQGQDNKVDMKFYIYPAYNNMGTGVPVSVLECSGMYANSYTYSFPTDGNATEEVTMVGNNKVWTVGDSSTNLYNTDASGNGEIARTIVRRWKFDKDNCVFPTGSGAMRNVAADGGELTGLPPLNNVSVSFDLGREPIYTLGTYDPYLRTVTFPVEISTEIETLASDGDFLNISEKTYGCIDDAASKNFKPKNKPIKFVICGTGSSDKLTLDLGGRNKLSSVSYGGGEAGGGNLTITYSFTTDNTFTMNATGSWVNVEALEFDAETGEGAEPGGGA